MSDDQIRVTDATSADDAPSDALANVYAAIALLAEHDPRRAARLRLEVAEIMIVDPPVTIWTLGRALAIGSHIAVRHTAEAVAVMLVAGLTALRLKRAVRRGGLDTSAQIRRRQRLEAEEFARRLPDGEAWASWAADWLGAPPLGSPTRQMFATLRMLRRYGLSPLAIRLTVCLSRSWHRIMSVVRRRPR